MYARQIFVGRHLYISRLHLPFLHAACRLYFNRSKHRTRKRIKAQLNCPAFLISGYISDETTRFLIAENDLKRLDETMQEITFQHQLVALDIHADSRIFF